MNETLPKLTVAEIFDAYICGLEILKPIARSIYPDFKLRMYPMKSEISGVSRSWLTVETNSKVTHEDYRDLTALGWKLQEEFFVDGETWTLEIV